MRILYGLYDEYNKINARSKNNNYDSCDNFHLWANNHNEAIDKYYENDSNLYQKFKEIKELIDNLKTKSNSPCIKGIYLKTPNEVIKLQEEEEAKKKAAEQQEQEQRAQEQKQREEELEEQLDSVLALTGEVSNILSGFGTTENEVLSPRQHAREERLPENQISSREQPYLEGNKYTDSRPSSLELLGRKKGQLDQFDLNQDLYLVYLEEEDDSVKFLVVLEDLHQEIS
ncbi:hypothetical protein PVIIG_00426 [Plasmodium vivax India VII]|uniref:Uncharacterized protein n=1 Tax=Plasmodium vivax India VII TaxID=1077284 RepID=A0A0J9S6N0_PLAVI|nr:hypothetical protein PVIIG_00426 [Plasmodium vivax India VII]